MTAKRKSKIIRQAKQSNKDRFQGYFPGHRGIFYRTSPQDREQKAAEQREREQAKWERFRQNREKGRRFLTKTKVLAYWLKQVEIAMSGPEKYWGDTHQYDWPKDKAIIYAIMAVCIDRYSAIKIIPESLRQTECYKVNKKIWFWVENFDLSTEFMNYIEEDLRNEGLLDSVAKVTGIADEDPDDLITLLVAVKDYGVSRATFKRAIKENRLKSYRPKNASTNTPHQVSRAEVECIWPKRKSE